MNNNNAYRLSVAPMMDWTDRRCRRFHRAFTRRAMLYTEMVTAPAVIHGDRDRLLGHDAADGPVTLQLGGSDPADLARAVRLARPYGYAEVNLNCGCPSDRVQSGCFGAVLMQTPDRVADCLRAMQAETDQPVSVKCRIGVDDQDPQVALPQFIHAVADAGVRHVIIHARKAWLQGLSPKQNREIPPLDHALVLKMKCDFPDLTLSVNGGITTLDQARGLLAQGLDGVMVGRAGPMHCGATPMRRMFSTWRRRCGPTSPHIWRQGAACTSSPAICWACSQAAPARACGGGCCRTGRRATLASTTGRLPPCRPHRCGCRHDATGRLAAHRP